MNKTVLEIDGLTKLFGNGRGIEDITLSVEEGDVLGLLGPNGSGKTTTMRCAVGLCAPDSGSVRIFGKDIETDFEAAMNNVGCLIEMPAIFGNMSAYKNMLMAARFYKNVGEEQIMKYLSLVSLDKYAKDKAGRFSLGMKQKLGLTMALLSEPKIIFLDEPANGLDIEGIIHVREVINHLAREKGITFIVSSHIAAELEKTCNKVAVIHEGKMLSMSAMEEALRFNPTLEDYFLNIVKEERGSIVL